MGWLLIFLLLLLPLCLACYFIKRPKSGGGDTLPPSPPTLPVIGNLHQLGQFPHRSLTKLSTKCGPLMLLHLGRQPVLVVSSAHMAKEVFRNHDIAFSDRPLTNNLKKIFFDGNDIFNLPYGDQWRKLRRIVVHELLSSTRVKSFDSIREDEMTLFVKKMEEFSLSSRPVNLSEMLATLSNDLISLAAFGKKYGEGEHGKKFMEAVDEGVRLLGNFSVGDFIPWLAWIDWLNGRDAAFDRIAEIRDEVLDAIIGDHLKSSYTNKENIVDILLGIYRGDIPGVSIDLMTVKGVILDILTAGTETSTTSLIWMMTELMRHREVMKTLQDEIRCVMQGKCHITDDDLKKMSYLKAVMNETFRLHPPLPIFSRVARENVNLMGYEVAARTMVLINAWDIGQDATYWDNPHEFIPERFLNSYMDIKGFHFHLIPFGAGRRICPGLGFSTMFIEHTIANLMLKFDWAFEAKGDELDVAERQGFTIGKKTPLFVTPTIHSTN